MRRPTITVSRRSMMLLQAQIGALSTAQFLSRGVCVIVVESEEILGMTFDLKSAYRQLAVSDASLKRARLAANDPHQRKTELYQQYSLPFGARAWVIAFIRCARMIGIVAW